MYWNDHLGLKNMLFRTKVKSQNEHELININSFQKRKINFKINLVYFIISKEESIFTAIFFAEKRFHDFSHSPITWLHIVFKIKSQSILWHFKKVVGEIVLTRETLIIWEKIEVVTNRQFKRMRRIHQLQIKFN